MEKEKMMKSAKIIDRILKIIQGFAAAGVIVAAIFIPLTAILGEKVIAESSRLELGHLTLKLAGDMSSYLDLSGIKASIIVMLISAVVGCAVGWYCLRMLRNVLAPLKEGRPFESGMAGRIRTLGFPVLIGGAITAICRTVGAVFELKAYDLSAVFDSDMVASAAYNYSLDLWFVVVTLILFFLSYIFRYGEDLQREADETL